jgi:hypothetical protein
LSGTGASAGRHWEEREEWERRKRGREGEELTCGPTPCVIHVSEVSQQNRFDNLFIYVIFIF